MSVLIKGMKIPKNCFECPLETDYGTCGYYSLFVEGGHDSDWRKRRDDCPLVELPDHGDLIDRDELMMKMWGADAYASNQCSCNVRVVFVRDIEAAPVVIPAERNVKVCPLYSDDKVKEYCVEGPCTDEMEGRCPIAEKDPDPIDLLRLSYKKAKENDQKRTGEIW